jgi:aldehyde dehydrogenase (NAD+)
MFIDGQWVDAESGETMDVINPGTGEVVARVPLAGKSDVDKAVNAARRAFDSGVWASKPKGERARILGDMTLLLLQNSDRIGYLEALTSGNCIRRTKFVDVGTAVLTFHTTAQLLDELPEVEHAPDMPSAPVHSFHKREPIGVCAGIAPWNVPLMIAGWKIAPCLAMGNSMVFKPASITPLTALELARCAKEAGVPDGVLNVITGPGAQVGNYMAAHPGIDKISITGSTASGISVAKTAAESVKKVTLELGGKSPLIVLDDADMDVAINIGLLAFLYHEGQICLSGTRLFVPRHMQDALVAGMIEKIKLLKIGNQMDPLTDQGPIASLQQLNTILGYIEIGKEEGAELVYGGKRLTDPEHEKGFFVEPTIFMNCNNQMRHVREEIFGPVQCVIPYDDLEDAIAMANDSKYGLAGGVVSTNVARAQKVACRLRTGTVWINNYHLIRPDSPFGGYKQSGYGRENSMEALYEYSQLKHICQDMTPNAAEKFWNYLLGFKY